MRWSDALTASKVGRAERLVNGKCNYDPDEPNVVLNDPKFPKAPKAFRAGERYGWRRIRLKEADKYDDWIPMDSEKHLEF